MPFGLPGMAPGRRSSGLPEAQRDRDLPQGQFRTGGSSGGAVARSQPWWSQLEKCGFNLTNLESANLGGADLRGAKLDRAFMNEAILCNTIMPDGRIEYSGCLLPTLKQLLNAFEQR